MFNTGQRVEVKPGGGDDVLPGERQPGPALEGPHGLTDHRRIDAAPVKEMEQKGGYHSAVSSLGPHLLAGGPAHGIPQDGAHGGAPGDQFFGLFFQFLDHRTDGIADAALDAFVLIGVARSAIRPQLQGPVINGGAKGHTTTALVAQARFLDLMDQIGKSFHNALLPLKPKFRLFAHLMSPGCLKTQAVGTWVRDL